VNASERRQEEYRRQKAERKRLRELEEAERIRAEQSIRTVLDRHHPEGIPADLVEGICGIANRLIRKIALLEKVIREMHDGVHKIAEEAAWRDVAGYKECARQVREHGEELGLSPEVLDSLLRNLVAMEERERAERDRAASSQVEWSRG